MLMYRANLRDAISEYSPRSVPNSSLFSICWRFTTANLSFATRCIIATYQLVATYAAMELTIQSHWLTCDNIFNGYKLFYLYQQGIEIIEQSSLSTQFYTYLYNNSLWILFHVLFIAISTLHRGLTSRSEISCGCTSIESLEHVDMGSDTSPPSVSSGHARLLPAPATSLGAIGGWVRLRTAFRSVLPCSSRLCPSRYLYPLTTLRGAVMECKRQFAADFSSIESLNSLSVVCIYYILRVQIILSQYALNKFKHCDNEETNDDNILRGIYLSFCGHLGLERRDSVPSNFSDLESYQFDVYSDSNDSELHSVEITSL